MANSNQIQAIALSAEGSLRMPIPAAGSDVQPTHPTRNNDFRVVSRGIRDGYRIR